MLSTELVGGWGRRGKGGGEPAHRGGVVQVGLDWMTGRWHAKNFPKFTIQWAVVGSPIRRLPMRRFSTSVVAACVVVVLGGFTHTA